MADTEHRPTTPKYAIGDVVWIAKVQSTTAELPCPDCLGSREWKVVTPAGNALATECRRCSSAWSSSGLPSLKYQTWVGIAERRPITGMTVKLGAPVEYQSGSPSSYYTLREEEMFASEDAALAEARARATGKNAEQRSTPGALVDRRLADLTYDDARFSEFKNGLWEAFYAYRRLSEDVTDWAKGATLSADDREALDSVLHWDRQRTPSGLDAAIRAADQFCNENPGAAPKLSAALAALPQFTLAALLSDSLGEADAISTFRASEAQAEAA